jgi:hypothetical protein
MEVVAAERKLAARRAAEVRHRGARTNTLFELVDSYLDASTEVLRGLTRDVDVE